MNARTFLVGFVLLLSPLRAHAAAAANVVTDWAAIVQQAIHNPPAAPRSAGTSEILHTMVMLAVYDAAVAIEGGFRPYAAEIRRLPYADIRAAVATAAYRTARARIASSQVAYLDQQYAAYLAGIGEGLGKAEGIRVGEAAAQAVLTRRAGDGFDAAVLYECSGAQVVAGEFEPDAGCPSGPTSPQPVDVKVGRIRPFAIDSTERYLPDGPDPLASVAYAEDFQETRDYGRIDSVFRSPDQTDLAYFWSDNPYVFWNRNLIALATSQQLPVLETARLFAMVHTAVADAIIVGFDAKYRFTAWRPRTAIPRADADDNPDTDADPTWRPLLTVNHPEYPSGHGFWSTALTDTVAAFFRTNKVTWTLSVPRTAVPALDQTERTYDQLNAVMRDVDDARVYGGLHWRHSMRHGAQIGRRVAADVARRYFGVDEEDGSRSADRLP
jgi:hypothetical protein